MKLDMVTVLVVNNRLKEIQNVMMQTLYRTGYSVILRESKDGSAGITDKDGNFLNAVAIGILHAPAYKSCIKAIQSAWSSEEIQAGDMFIFNDPYTTGCFHTPDIGLVAPIFYKDELIAFATSVSHKPDIGGIVPGSMSANARSLFHEGIIIPPVKLYERGRLNESMMRLIMRNSRTSYLLGGDIRGQAGCVRQGTQMLEQLCDEYGVEVVLGSFDELINITERRMRAELEALPDGETEVERHLDDDGVDFTQPVKIHLRLKKNGDRISFDFSGSAPQTIGPVNAGPSIVESMIVMTLVGFIDPDIEINQGVMKVVDLILPEGSVINPTFPAPHGTYAPTGRMVRHCIIAGLSELFPEKGIAEPGGGTGALTFGYHQSKSGQSKVQYEITWPALGANAGADGANLIGTILNWASVAPIEILETEYPVRLREFSVRQNSGGTGKHRGGLAYVREYEVLEDCSFTARVSGIKFAAQGIQEGKGPQPCRLILNPGTSNERELPSLISLDLHAGDIIRHELSGGGGYGNPLERNRDAVVKDVQDGYISEESARRDYGLDEMMLKKHVSKR